MTIPAVLREEEILIPCKIDVKLNGARYVDCFMWNLYSSVLSPDEFARSIVRDLNLPVGFRPRIALQLCEQVEAFADFVSTVHSLLPADADIVEKLPALNKMSLELRHMGVEYKDTFAYDMQHSFLSPEEFAIITCAELGLPAEMEPAIAIKIRDTIIQLYMAWVSKLSSEPSVPVTVTGSSRARSGSTGQTQPPSLRSAATATATAFTGASSQETLSRFPCEVQVSAIPAHMGAEMNQSMWRACKPADRDVVGTASNPVVPIGVGAEKQGNFKAWLA